MAEHSGNSRDGCTASPEAEGGTKPRGRPGLFTASRTATAVRLLILALAAGLIYHSTLQGPFVFDDIEQITDNPHIQLQKLSLPGLIGAGFDSPNPRRVFANISFALNYRIHATDVFGYHLVNLLLHVATGILLYFFTRATLQLLPARRGKPPVEAIAFFAALIWSVHPVQTQTVNYIVQRMTGMAAFFYLGALLAYVTARKTERPVRRRILFAAAAVTGILAMGSKEIALTLPVFIVLYEWYFFQNLDRTWLKKHGMYLAPLLLIAAPAALLWVTRSHSSVMQFLTNGYAAKGFTLSERLLTEFRVGVYYISLLAWPDPRRLHLDYDFQMSRSLLQPPTTLPAIILIGALGIFALVRADKNRLLSFGILWFLGNLVIESSVIPLDLVYEHRLYLPSMFVGVVGVAAAYRWIPFRRAVPIGLCLVAVGFSFWSIERNAVWQNAVALWKDNVAKTPQNTRAYTNFGRSYYGAGNLEDAIANFRKALAIDPAYAKARINLGLAMLEQDRYEEAEAHLLQAVELAPDNPAVHTGLGALMLKQDRIETAVAHLAAAVKLDPRDAAAHNNLGAALARQGRLSEAFEQYRVALELAPEYADAYNNVGILLLRKGRETEAASLFEKALQIDPQHAGARKNLNRTKGEKGPPAENVGL